MPSISDRTVSEAYVYGTRPGLGENPAQQTVGSIFVGETVVYNKREPTYPSGNIGTMITTTGNKTISIPSWCTNLLILASGGGKGGQAGNGGNNSAGKGGGSASFTTGAFDVTNVNSFKVNIGSGGNGGTGSNGWGGEGGDTTVTVGSDTITYPGAKDGNDASGQTAPLQSMTLSSNPTAAKIYNRKANDTIRFGSVGNSNGGNGSLGTGGNGGNGGIFNRYTNGGKGGDGFVCYIFYGHDMIPGDI